MADTPIPPSATYNQRYGGDPLPAVMNQNDLNNEIRVNLEDLIVDFITRPSARYARPSTKRYFPISAERFVASMQRILGAYYVKSKHDYRSITHESLCKTIKSIMSDAEVKNVLKFLEIFLDEYESLIDDVQKIFEQYSAPFYLLSDQGYARFHPSTLPAEGESVKGALQSLNDFGYSGAAKHLLDASASLNRNDYAGCVRDSIHAVESVAKIITGDDNATLGNALNQLEGQGLEIHPALKGALNQIYGYTSDEKGIRHALLDEPAKVDQNLAMFMFGACASFAAYLVNENRKRSEK